MTIYKEDENNHNCEKIYGKCYHVCVDSMNNFYCMFCFRKILITQLASKWQESAKDN